MALRGPLLEKAMLLGVPAAALAAVLAASFVLTTQKSRPPDVVFEGKLSPGEAPAPTSSGAVTRAADTTPPKITATAPTPNATVDTDFTDVVITFNENIDPASLDANTVQVYRSGGDGLFDNGNDVQIVPDAIEPLDATHARVVLPSGLPPDTYRVILRGWPLSASGSSSSTSSSSSSSTSSSTSSSNSTTTGQNSTTTTATSSSSTSNSTSNSTSSSTASSSNSTSSTATTSTATSGATSSATSSTTTSSASNSSTSSATSNSSSTSSNSSSTSSTSGGSTTTSTSGAPPGGGCSDASDGWPVANSSSGSGYFGG